MTTQEGVPIKWYRSRLEDSPIAPRVISALIENNSFCRHFNPANLVLTRRTEVSYCIGTLWVDSRRLTSISGSVDGFTIHSDTCHISLYFHRGNTDTHLLRLTRTLREDDFTYYYSYRLLPDTVADYAGEFFQPRNGSTIEPSLTPYLPENLTKFISRTFNTVNSYIEQVVGDQIEASSELWLAVRPTTP